MGQVGLLSLVTASVAFTLCETTLLADQWAERRSVRLGKVVCCGYCPGGGVVFSRRAPRIWNRVTRGSPCRTAA